MNTNDPMYVQFFKEYGGEPIFKVGGKEYYYCWANYPNGTKDLGVYSMDEDLCYGYRWFRTNILKIEL